MTERTDLTVGTREHRDQAPFFSPITAPEDRICNMAGLVPVGGRTEPRPAPNRTMETEYRTVGVRDIREEGGEIEMGVAGRAQLEDQSDEAKGNDRTHVDIEQGGTKTALEETKVRKLEFYMFNCLIYLTEG